MPYKFFHELGHAFSIFLFNHKAKIEIFLWDREIKSILKRYFEGGRTECNCWNDFCKYKIRVIAASGVILPTLFAMLGLCLPLQHTWLIPLACFLFSSLNLIPTKNKNGNMSDGWYILHPEDRWSKKQL